MTEASPPVTRRIMPANSAIAGGSLPATLAARAAASAALIASTWDFGAAANAAGYCRLQAGGSLLDAIEAAGRVPEADPTNHSVGYSAYPDRDGRVTLDAIIMEDAGGMGAVAALENTVHAISVARAAMEHTPHMPRAAVALAIRTKPMRPSVRPASPVPIRCRGQQPVQPPNTRSRSWRREYQRLDRVDVDRGARRPRAGGDGPRPSVNQ